MKMCCSASYACAVIQMACYMAIEHLHCCMYGIQMMQIKNASNGARLEKIHILPNMSGVIA